MEISPLKFHFALTPDDVHSIREAVREWGEPVEKIDGFNGAELYRNFESWDQFVDTNWDDWDKHEYSYDISCRFWIQIAIEHSLPATRSVLEEQVAIIDARFQTHMKPVKRLGILEGAPLSGHPYFWESHTIHPEL